MTLQCFNLLSVLWIIRKPRVHYTNLSVHVGHMTYAMRVGFMKNASNDSSTKNNSYQCQLNSSHSVFSINETVRPYNV